MEPDPILDSKVAAALLIIQFVIIISVFFGAVISGYWGRIRPYFLSGNDKSILSSGVLDFAFLMLWMLLSIIPILLTVFFKPGWDTLGFHFPVTPTRSATAIAFWANIMFCSWFVFRSGGWSSSPFSSVLVALPMFAILIGEPLSRTGLYVLAIVSIIGVSMLRIAYSPSMSVVADLRVRHSIAVWLLASVMLALTTALGYIRALPYV